jgi:hypothetical protein
MTKQIENWQIKKIQTVLKAKNLVDSKLDLFDSVCNGRVINSTKELYFEEANRLIKTLDSVGTNNYNAANQMRRKIISCCRECGWTANGKADMARINAWVLKYGYLGKPLMEYNSNELPKLVTQAENMKDSFIKSL